ncbi:unnamed protein product (macronuclear) [Paramecium tetraurelia]|uniref:Transmembrane protein n=1 Tax=Paramecium tetraurelia TaxID=5888 RepID=A0DUF7_PARTE|nr:uncharacterized protein GSPATT00020346001 [Paramecium tetraurelia]CAK86674.1 unnamed protein product [Paramecium tetraurelia]|eukprot:XP_001454071.1 hypothetical protein (macronuclear) [Paramecium tetraurelia strain d4-2]
MQKLTPSAHSQISTPNSIRRLHSFGNSNGVVLMNQYFNLPLISTKSTKEYQGIQVIKPNTISMIGEFDDYNQYHPQENNKIQLQTLVSKGEKSPNCPNYTILEMYYQNKSISNKKPIKKRKLVRPSQEAIEEQKPSRLQNKIVQNFDKPNDSSKYTLERNYYSRQGELNEDAQQFIFPDLNQVSHSQKNSEFEILTQRIKLRRRKLKVIFLFVFSTMVISKQFRFFKQEERQLISKLNKKLQSCQKIILQNGVKFIEEQQQQFVQIISNKVIHYLNSRTYINECNLIDELSNPIQSLDLKKIRAQSFSKLIYQNLELLTRSSNFPKLLKCQLITSLYKTSKQQSSFFVGERCHFYSADRIHISREEKLVISMEYLLFQIVVPNLVQLVNKIPQSNKKCKIQTQKIIIIIASLLHQQFIDRFQNMRKVKNPNGYMVNKQLIIQYMQNDLFLNEIKVAHSTGDNNKVLEGLIDQEQLQYLEISKPLWKSQIDILFEKVVQNVESLINF